MIEPQDKTRTSYEPRIYKGFDSHSQVGLVREILNHEIIKKGRNLNKTLILLPDANNLIPLLSEISLQLKEFNVSMGYPLKRSSLFSLFQYIFEAQLRRKDGAYYSRDYLKVILHPIIKNLLLDSHPATTRILMHKIEELLRGMIETPLAGSLFVKLEDIEKQEELYRAALNSLASQQINFTEPDLRHLLKDVHQLSFGIWEEIENFASFISSLEDFSEVILYKSFALDFPLNAKIIERIYQIFDELKEAEFKDQPFTQEELFKIFTSKLEDERIAFSGSALKGLQVLGLLETRSLSFENVIVMDTNEGVLPKIRVYEPLIPRQVMKNLGLKQLNQEEEIERYHFMRLINAAKNVHFVYDDNPEKERSRFIEEIVWQRQKEKKELSVLKEWRARFAVNVAEKKKMSAGKNRQTLDYLKNDFVYSASSLDTYLACPLQFYYQYVLRLKEKESLLGEPETQDVGIFIHKLLEDAFREFLGKKPLIDRDFEKKFFELFHKRFAEDLRKRTGAQGFMIEDVMEYRLRRFLDDERERPVKKILSLEERVDRIRMDLAGRSLLFGWRIDRVDLLEDDSLLVLDYKTGASTGAPQGLKKLEEMMLELSRQSIKETVNSFQLPLYYYFAGKKFKDKPLNAKLYFISTLNFTDFIKKKDSPSAPKVMECCFKALEYLIGELLNPGVDFEADDTDENICKYCAFFGLCK
jgi:hypothetical protein